MRTLPFAPRAFAACMLLATSLSVSACNLTGAIDMSPGGRAALSFDVGIDRALIDGEGPTCTQVLEGTLGALFPADQLTITPVPDQDSLRCHAGGDIDVVAAGWDGQDGRPLWEEDAQAPRYRLLLPLSQGTGSGDISAQDLQEALGSAASATTLTIHITMPANITEASIGTVQGRTLSLEGPSVVMSDIDIRAGEPESSPSVTTAVLVVGIIVAISLMLGALALLIRRALASKNHPDPTPTPTLSPVPGAPGDATGPQGPGYSGPSGGPGPV